MQCLNSKCLVETQKVFPLCLCHSLSKLTLTGGPAAPFNKWQTNNKYLFNADRQLCELFLNWNDLSKTIRTICQKLSGPCCIPVACRQQTPAWSCFNGKNNQFTKYCLRPPLSHLSSNIPEHRNYLEWFGQTKGEFQLLSLDVDIF